MQDIHSWKQDLYPLIQKRFDLRYNSRMDIMSSVVGIVEQDIVDYRLEGIGGYGELPAYNGSTIVQADQKRAFISTITPEEHAIAVPVSLKRNKIDATGEALRTGNRLADSAYMTVLNHFYRLFQNAFTQPGADGKPWASDAHPINTVDTDVTFSNLINDNLSVAAITRAQTQASRFVTPDGLPFACNFDLLLVSPELEPRAKEICGAEAKLCPDRNPDNNTNAANPVYGMKYLVVGGGGTGFSSKQWAICDQMLLAEVVKLVYITKPTVLIAQQDNPLVTNYIGYVDFGIGYGDARPIIFSNP